MDTLFDGAVQIDSTDELKKINKDTALIILEMGINYTNMKGLFTLEESHTLYECLQKLKEQTNE